VNSPGNPSLTCFILGGSTGADLDQTATSDIYMISRGEYIGMIHTGKMKVPRYSCFPMITGANDTELFVMGGTFEPEIDLYHLVEGKMKAWPEEKVTEIEKDLYIQLVSYTCDVPLKDCSYA